MLQMLNPSTRAKARIKMAKARMKWNWRLGKARAKKNWWQFKMKPRQANSSPVLGTVLGSAAGLLAIFAVTSAMGRRKKTALAQRGQAPSRFHIKRASHPSGQIRFEPMKKMFGRA